MENEITQIIHGPFIFIQPYRHIYKTYAKKRWLGRQLLDVMSSEYKAYNHKYYEEAILSGKICINGKTTSPDYPIKNGDLLQHNALREEPPILNLPIGVLYENDEYLVVNKPPGLIVHTGGGYHYNTLISILSRVHHYGQLLVVHRLDKLTSGILILAKKKESVIKFHEESSNTRMKKMYYARVEGKFPWNQKTLCATIKCLSFKDGIYGVEQEISQQQYQEMESLSKRAELKKKQKNTKITQIKEVKQENNQEEEYCNLNIYGQNYKHKYPENGAGKQQYPRRKFKDIDSVKEKFSKTLFKFVDYNQKSDSTLLECYPTTGRTHQIRVHLKFLGHPIINDTDYGGRFVGNKIIETIQTEGQMDCPSKKIKLQEGFSTIPNYQNWDYKQRPWEIYLHSFSYHLGQHEFRAPLPHWCQSLKTVQSKQES